MCNRRGFPSPQPCHPGCPPGPSTFPSHCTQRRPTRTGSPRPSHPLAGSRTRRSRLRVPPRDGVPTPGSDPTQPGRPGAGDALPMPGCSSMNTEAQMTRAYHPICSAERSLQAGIWSTSLDPMPRPAMSGLSEGLVLEGGSTDRLLDVGFGLTRWRIPVSAPRRAVRRRPLVVDCRRSVASFGARAGAVGGTHSTACRVRFRSALQSGQATSVLVTVAAPGTAQSLRGQAHGLRDCVIWGRCGLCPSGSRRKPCEELCESSSSTWASQRPCSGDRS
jgi:hypothetical protein